MFCPNPDCSHALATGEPAEYRDGIAACADCGSALVETMPDSSADDVLYEAFVPVLTLEGAAMVSFVTSLLDGAGIRFFIKNDTVQDLFGFGRLGTGFSPITGAPIVFVEPSRADEAHELLATTTVDPAFSDFRRRVTRFERMHGYYIVDLVSVETQREAGQSQEELLESVFRQFDDEPWPAEGERPRGPSWEEHAVSASEAEGELVAALVGGRDVGHKDDTIPPETARELWAELVSFFPDEPRFYVGMGFGDRSYVHLRGVVIVDDKRAGIVWVVEGD